MNDSSSKSDSHLPQEKKTLEELASQNNQGVISDFVYFLRTNKRWWLTPIILVLLLVGAVAVASGTVAAPFLYSFW